MGKGYGFSLSGKNEALGTLNLPELPELLYPRHRTNPFLVNGFLKLRLGSVDLWEHFERQINVFVNISNTFLDLYPINYIPESITYLMRLIYTK